MGRRESDFDEGLYLVSFAAKVYENISINFARLGVIFSKTRFEKSRACVLKTFPNDSKLRSEKTGTNSI